MDIYVVLECPRLMPLKYERYYIKILMACRAGMLGGDLLESASLIFDTSTNGLVRKQFKMTTLGTTVCISN